MFSSSTALPEEKEYDVKHRDFCTEEFNRNQLQTEEKGCEKFDLIGKIQDLKMFIKTLTEETDHVQGSLRWHTKSGMMRSLM